AKHSGASIVNVTVVTDTASGVLHVTVSDDGVGGAHFDHGTGRVGIQDRAEAMGAGMFLDSPVGAGTTLRIELPLSATPVAQEIRGEQAYASEPVRQCSRCPEPLMGVSGDEISGMERDP